MLSDRAIKNLKARATAYRVADGYGKGLFLFVTPTGGKLWRFKYRFDGLQKQISYGQFPDVPLDIARERHQAARKLLAAGIDPMAQRKAEKTAVRNANELPFREIFQVARTLEGRQQRPSCESDVEPLGVECVPGIRQRRYYPN
jgi:hypothetical protein